MPETPAHIETRLRNALQDAQILARQRGLTDLFAMELHAAGSAVREALVSRRRDRALAAGRQVANLKAHLRRTPPKPRARRADAAGGRRGPAMGRRRA